MEFLTALIVFFIAWKWGDWKNWKIYYPTILYFIIANLVSNLLTYNHPLWQYESSLVNRTLSDLLITVVVFPSTVLLFLPYFPNKITSQITYITKWVAVYSAVEWVYYSKGFLSYHNGWNIGWSILLNFIMFPLLWLHYRKPLWTWPISMLLAFLIVIIFGIPFNSMK
jgi:cobalamin synthase